MSLRLSRDRRSLNGSWGTGIFQNDEVLDWINELVEHSSIYP
ncbi:DUF4259 domain-containing protein [Paenibacillus lacisoli]